MKIRRLLPLICLLAVLPATHCTYVDASACYECVPEHSIDGQFRPIMELWGVSVAACQHQCALIMGNAGSQLCRTIVYNRRAGVCKMYSYAASKSSGRGGGGGGGGGGVTASVPAALPTVPVATIATSTSRPTTLSLATSRITLAPIELSSVVPIILSTTALPALTKITVPASSKVTIKPTATTALPQSSITVTAAPTTVTLPSVTRPTPTFTKRPSVATLDPFGPQPTDAPSAVTIGVPDYIDLSPPVSETDYFILPEGGPIAFGSQGGLNTAGVLGGPGGRRKRQSYGTSTDNYDNYDDSTYGGSGGRGGYGGSNGYGNRGGNGYGNGGVSRGPKTVRTTTIHSIMQIGKGGAAAGFIHPAFGYDVYIRTGFEGPLGNCSSPMVPPPTVATTTSTAAPITTSAFRHLCPADTRTAYMLFIGKRAPDSVNDAILDLSLSQAACSSACTINVVDLGGDGLDVDCGAVNFRPLVALEACEILGEKTPFDLVDDNGSIYAQKACMRTASCANPDAADNDVSIYVSNVGVRPVDSALIDIRDAESVERCMEECMGDSACRGSVFDGGKCELYESAEPSERTGGNVIFVENPCNTGPNVWDCPADTPTVNFILYGGFDLDYVEGPETTESGLSPEECAALCAANEDSSGNRVRCASIAYDVPRQECHMYRVRPQVLQTNDASLFTDINYIYAEKICLSDIDETSDCGVSVGYVDVVPGGASPIVEVPTLHAEECLQACMVTPTCRSATFKASLQFNCRLFNADPIERAAPEQFALTMVNGCNPVNVKRTFRSVFDNESASERQSKRFARVLAKPSKWTDWSPCQFTVKQQRVRMRCLSCSANPSAKCDKDKVQVQKC